MPYFFAIAIGGGAVAAGVAAVKGLGRARRTTLADSLAPSESAPETAGRLARWDERYQRAVHDYLDPWLTGKTRQRQYLEMSGGEEREASEFEKKLNRQIGIGVSSLGALAVARYAAVPIGPLIVATGLYMTWPFFKEAFRIAVQERRFSIFQLMMLYFAAMWLGGYYVIGMIGAILASLSQKIQVFTELSARRNLIDVFGQQPRQVWLWVDGAEIETKFESLQAGDIVVVGAGQSIPADGVIVQGMASVDQHRLTGESQPAEKGEGDAVLASTTVLGGRILVRVEKAGIETSAAQIAEILNRTVEQQEQIQMRQFEIAEKSLLPMLACGALGWSIAGPAAGVAAFGCNYVLNVVPLRLLAMLNFLNASSERGILIKDGQALETLQTVDAVVFDKTGTLTLDQPVVTRIRPLAGYTETQILAWAAAAEHRQSHPIARAILAAAAEREISLPSIDEANYRVGYGIEAETDGRRVRVGSQRYLESEGFALPESLQAIAEDCKRQAHSLVYVAADDELAGAIELQAALRPEAEAVIEGLRRAGYALYIVSGDQEAPTRQLAEHLGMNGYFANTLPEKKAERVEALQRQGHKVCFIGDGINDAVALRQADVSISLRGAASAATDAAQIVLMEDRLEQLQTLFELTRRFNDNVSKNFNLAAAASLLAVGGVLAFPAIKFWIVEFMAATQLLTGVSIASSPLLASPESEGEGGSRRARPGP